MNVANFYAVGTILVASLVIFGDIYDLAHGRVLDKQGSIGSACGIAGWAWFFITIAIFPFLIINKSKTRGALTFLITLVISVFVWIASLWPLQLPVIVPVWLYIFDLIANFVIVIVSITTIKKGPSH